MERKAVTTTREVPALQVPSGYRVLLPKGTWLVVQQTLGGQFTCMTESGGLVRVDGVDADALGPEYEAEAKRIADERAAASAGPFDEEKVWEALRQVYDPEIPASIVELGLVRTIAIEDDGPGPEELAAGEPAASVVSGMEAAAGVDAVADSPAAAAASQQLSARNTT